MLQAPPPSPDTRRRNAQRAKERREATDSSLSIRERIPKLKYTSSLLPAMHTPRHLTGRGGGKKSATLFAADYFPAHRNPGAPPTRPYRLLRPAKQAAPPQPDVAAVGSSHQAVLPAGRAAAPGSAQRFVSARRYAKAPRCTSGLGPAVAVTSSADGLHLGGRALYPGGLLLVVLMGI